jgi:hypothetical protein
VVKQLVSSRTLVWLLLAASLVLCLVWLGLGEQDEVTIRGLVVTPDQREGIVCDVEVNSAKAPFIVPLPLRVEVGKRFGVEMTRTQVVPGMYFAVRCDGYETVIRSFDLGPRGNVDLGRLVLTPKDVS